MKKANQKYTILYARLSREDKNNGESDSIQNQKIMLEKYVSWHEQVKKESSLIALKELQQLLKGKSFITSAPTQLVREYQGKKHEVSMHPNGCFFYEGKQYKSLSKIAREITGTNWNGKLFFRVTPKGASLGTK